MGSNAATALAAIFFLVALVAVTVAVRASTRARAIESTLAEVRAGATSESVAFARSAERFDAVLAALGDGIVLCGPGGDVVSRNPAAAEILDDAAGGTLVASAVERTLRSALDSADGTAVESLDLFGPPRRALMIAATRLVDATGTILGGVAALDDVSDRRQVDAMRRDFVANMSHELKTPVGALGLLAETIVDEPDPQVARRLAERLHEEAHRVNRIIEDLLDLSRIESESTVPDETVSVPEIVTHATDRLRSAAERREITLDVALTLPADAKVVGDRRQLVSAVHSLVENAIAYTEPGGHVRVEAAGGDGCVRIIVSDTGVGIPTRDLDRIFERFYRVDRARARATGGTGLGLSIVRHVAQNHRGTVDVESQEGVGSTFTFELPTVPAAASSPVQSEEASI